MPRKIASSFTLHSVDHDQVLLSNEHYSTRHLLEDVDQTPKTLKLTFTLDGETQESLLHRTRGAFAEDATISIMTAEGLETKEAPELYAYYSEDKNWVLTFHDHNVFDGLVFSEDGKNIYHFVGEDGEMKINADVTSFFPALKRDRKLSSEANGIDYWDDCHRAQSRGLSSMDIGIVYGNVFLQRFDDDRARREANSYITLSNTIYERQMDITLVIKDQLFIENPGQTNFTPDRCSMNIQTQVQRMGTWNPPSQQVVWHLLDDCFGASGGTLGIAYVGTLCSRYNVGVSYYSDHLYDADEYPTWATVAHELGHNFDAQHSFEEGQGRTGGIMDYGFLSGKLIDGEVQFNTRYREREVCREVDSAVSRGCVDIGVAASPTGQFTVPEPVSREVFAESPRSIKCAKHVHKMPASAEHLKRLNTNNALGCRKECAMRENCSGFVFSKEDGWCELLDGSIDVDNLAYTAEFNTYACFEREVEDRFFGRSEDDVLDTAKASSLKDQCCARTENQAFQGLNLNFRENQTQESCENECVKNSKCEAVSFDPVDSSCMMFGGQDFSHSLGAIEGVSTLSCDRPCISAAIDTNPASTNGALHIVGGLFVVAGVIGAVLGVTKWARKGSSTTTTESKQSANTGEVYQATL